MDCFRLRSLSYGGQVASLANDGLGDNFLPKASASILFGFLIPFYMIFII
jgi:hypothetical protein